MGVLMSLLKQAKTLSKRQITLTTALLQQTRYPARNLAIFLLSVKAGLRAKEIASLTWDMVTDAEGNLGSALHLRDEASKGSSGRVIPLNKDLRSALQKLHDERAQLTLRHHHRTIGAHVSRCNRQPLRSMVQRDGSQRLLKSLRTSHLHHQCSAHDLDCRRVSQGRSNARWTSSTLHHPALYRSGRGSSETGG